MVIVIASKFFFIFVLLFVLLFILVYTEITIAFDINTLHYFQNVSGNKIIDLSMWFITEISGIFPIIIFCISLIIIKTKRRLGLNLLFTIIISTILCGYMSYIIDRDPPQFKYIGTILPLDLEDDTSVLGNNTSFPSAHITRTTIIAFIMSSLTRKKYITYFIWIYPLLSSLSRIYFLQQYPMDIVSGIIFGVIISIIILTITNSNKN